MEIIFLPFMKFSTCGQLRSDFGADEEVLTLHTAAGQSANEAAGDTRCGRTEGSYCRRGSVTHLRGDAPAATPANGVATPHSLSSRGRRRSSRPSTMLDPAARPAAAQVRTQPAGGPCNTWLPVGSAALLLIG